MYEKNEERTVENRENISADNEKMNRRSGMGNGQGRGMGRRKGRGMRRRECGNGADACDGTQKRKHLRTNSQN